MGNIESEKWMYQEIQAGDYQENSFYYFKRKMNVGNSCIKSYFSHIFIQICQSQSEVINSWKQTNHYLALKYQSKIEDIIEKSNFYLCLFVREKVCVKVRNEIESDSFCAKKYIFEDEGQSLEGLLDDIENKIFRINCLIPFKKFPKLENMVLQNFRGFAGKLQIDFRNCRKRVASFVVIYAKNGVGKTSLFDGVEFALKGEIGRITSLAANDKNNKYTGAIYHNRDNADKDAFVSLMLEGNLSILRKVANVVEGGNDCAVKTATKGKEITGTKKEREKWNQIVLPHDKIDSFISAKSSTGQYKEWTKSAAPLTKETEAYENAYKECKTAQKYYDKLSDKRKEADDKLKGLSSSQAAVKKLIELIDSYNKTAEEEQILYFSNEADVEQYDRLVNQTKKCSRELGVKKALLEENISLAREVLNKGVSFCCNTIDSIEKLNKSIQKLDLQIQRKQEVDVLLQADKENLSAVVTYRKEVDFLHKIADYGIENVRRKNKEYQDVCAKIGELEKSLEYFKTRLNNAIEDSGKAELKKNQCTSAQLTEEEYKQALSNVRKLDEINKKLKKIQAEYDIAKEQGEQYEKSIALITETIERISSFRLPKDVMVLKSGEVLNAQIVLDDVMQARLYEFEDRYRKTSMQMQVCQEEISKQEKREGELEEFYQKGREYLNLHKNTNVCPLCHTSFEDWETLFFRINNIQEQNNGFLKERIGECHAEQILILDEYEKFYLQCEDLKEGQITSQKVKLENLIKESHSNTRKKINCEKKINALNKE